jgi:hypothetical protein
MKIPVVVVGVMDNFKFANAKQAQSVCEYVKTRVVARVGARVPQRRVSSLGTCKCLDLGVRCEQYFKRHAVFQT